MPKKSSGKVSPPVVSFKEEIAGHDTLAAIAEDRGRALFPTTRHRTTTKHYGDRISNAPGAVSPKAARAMDTSPEVSVSLRSPGRETYAVILSEHRREVPDIEVTTESDGDLDDAEYLDTLEIHRIHTFFVQAPPEHLRSREQRLLLVKHRLLSQMPGNTIDDVTKVELETSPTSGVVVRVWTRMID